MQSFLDYFSSNRDRFITEWRELLAFKSISADPAFHNDCLECAAWLSRHLEGLGFKTEIWPSDTKPLIYGVLPGNPTRPVILFYGHYDVQPVDPLNLWITPPLSQPCVMGACTRVEPRIIRASSFTSLRRWRPLK